MGRNRTLGAPYAVVTVTASFQTLADVDMYAVDVPGGGVTATLDPNAVDGDQVVIQDIAHVAGSEPITVVPGGAQTILNGFGSSYSIDSNGGAALFTYKHSLSGWVPQAILVGNNLPENVSSNGSVPSVVANTGAGTGATASLSPNSNDTAGQVTLTTGASGEGIGPQLTVTFAEPFAAPPRSVLIAAANTNAAGYIYYFYIGTVTATSFQIATEFGLGAGPVTFVFNYVVLG